MLHDPATGRLRLDPRLTPLFAAAAPLDFAVCFGVGLAAKGVLAAKARLDRAFTELLADNPSLARLQRRLETDLGILAARFDAAPFRAYRDLDGPRPTLLPPYRPRSGTPPKPSSTSPASPAVTPPPAATDATPPFLPPRPCMDAFVALLLIDWPLRRSGRIRLRRLHRPSRRPRPPRRRPSIRHQPRPPPFTRP